MKRVSPPVPVNVLVAQEQEYALERRDCDLGISAKLSRRVKRVEARNPRRHNRPVSPDKPEFGPIDAEPDRRVLGACQACVQQGHWHDSRVPSASQHPRMGAE